MPKIEVIHGPDQTLGEFAVFLKEHCQGDWWDVVLLVMPDPEHGACECCTWHPLTEKHADILNRIFEVVKDVGGPSPTAAYTHCSAELIVEWHSTDNQNAIILDITDRWGWSALVRLHPTPTYFVKVIDNREVDNVEK